MNFKDATQIGITLQRFILYTLASLSSDNNPTNFIFMHVCEFKTKSLEHTCRGSYHYQVGFLCCLSNLLQVVLMVDKQHKIQTKLAIYTCEVLAWNMLNFHIFVELSSITKKGEIESPCLVLVIE